MVVSAVSNAKLDKIEAGVVELFTVFTLLALFTLYCKKSKKEKVVQRLKYELLSLLVLIAFLGMFFPRIYTGENITNDVEGFFIGLSITMAFALGLTFILLIPACIIRAVALMPSHTSKKQEVSKYAKISLIEIFTVSWFLILFILCVF